MTQKRIVGIVSAVVLVAGSFTLATSWPELIAVASDYVADVAGQVIALGPTIDYGG